MQLYDALGDMFIQAGTNPRRVTREVFNNASLETAKSRGSLINVAKIAKIAEHCGYELCLVPAASVPRNAIPISSDQSEPKRDDGVRLGEAKEAAVSDDMIG